MAAPRWGAPRGRTPGSGVECTPEPLDVALKQDGSYYLAYQLMPTPQQLRRSYPEFDSFVDLKRKHDPNGMFESAFYRHYAGAGR